MPPPLPATPNSLAVSDAADFPNWLATPTVDRPSLAPRYMLLAALFVTCLVPRTFMARRIPAVCPDGVIYFRLAGEIERGEVDQRDAGLLQFGTFPVALAALHRLGFEWESAAKLYGVLLSSLAVLPLFGWARRQFDDRVAVIASLLYAAHPKLIEWSPEAIREPSFWFFFLLALYLQWRAATEVDWRLFAAAGAVTSLCCLTRFEGWFLTLPLIGWSVLRLVNLQTGRMRLACGAAIGVAIIPIVMLAFAQILPGSDGWRLVRLEPARRAAVWLASWISLATQGEAPASARAPGTKTASQPTTAPQSATTATVNPAPAVASAPAIAPPAVATATEPWTTAQAAWQFLRTLERGLTLLFAILMFVGYFAHWRLFHRSDSLPILLLILAVVAGIWIHLWYAHLASSRYVLTIVLVSTRAAALGALDLSTAASRLLARRRPVMVPTGAITAVITATVMIVGAADALSSDYRSRGALADLGRWIHDEYGDTAVLVGSENQLLLVGYYAHSTTHGFPPELAGDDLAYWVEFVKADVVVLSTRPRLPAEHQAIIDMQVRLQLAPLPAEQVPGGGRNMLVLARTRSPEEVVRQASRAAAPRP